MCAVRSESTLPLLLKAFHAEQSTGVVYSLLCVSTLHHFGAIWDNTSRINNHIRLVSRPYQTSCSARSNLDRVISPST